MDFVIDASVALSFVLPDGDTRQDLTAIRGLLRRGGAVVPAVFMPEILHVLVKAERRSRGVTSVLDDQLQAIRAMRLMTDGATPHYLESRSLPLARTHRLSIFDATYLELAMRRSLPLATFDNGLVRAAKARARPPSALKEYPDYAPPPWPPARRVADH